MTKRLLRLALAVWPVLFATSEAATVRHSEPLRALTVRDLAAATPSGGQPAALRFNAFARDFELALEPNARLARMQATLRLPPGTAAYRGAIAGRHGSWARIVLTPTGPAGLVFDGETLYGLEPGDAGSAARPPSAAVMFRLADVYFAPGELGGEHDAVAIDGSDAVAALTEDFVAVEARGAHLNLDIGAVADFEFSRAFGPVAEAALLTRINNIDGIFSEQLGVQVTLAATTIFKTPDDPFTASAASDLLEELARFRGRTPEQEAQGLTHLFTGRDLDGSTAGIAYFGAVCARRGAFGTRSFGAGLSEARRGAVIDSLVAAHEIGHSFGAPHDGEAGRACASTPTTFLMAPNINGSDRFSACSIEQMQAEIAGARCLTPIGAANVAVTLTPPTEDALAGVSFTQTATVLSLGTSAVADVTFTATTEQGLEIVAVDAGGSSCTVAANAASCALGGLDGGASRTVALTLRAPAAGSYAVTATVAASADEDEADDGDAVVVTAVPAVDLVWSATGSGAPLDTQMTIVAALDNAADIGATSVAVSATLSSGLRAGGATLGAASCTVSGQEIACPPLALAARGNVALTVVATAVSAGAQQVDVAVTSNEAERTPADNRLAIAVSVSAPAAQSDGGGGAVSWWSLTALLAAAGWRRRAGRERRRP